MQDFVDRALANDVTPMFKLIGGAPPEWNNPASTFYQNLQAVARAYRGRVRYWIVGNEIDGCGWWTPCDAAVFVSFLRNVAQVIRGVDPQAKVLAADLYKGESDVLRAMLAAEKAQPSLFDILSVHYLEEGDGENLSPDGCCGSINTYRRVMEASGISKPIWNTEALSPLVGGLHWKRNESSYFRGGDVVPFLSLAKTIVGNQAVGAQKVFFFSYNYDQTLLEGEGGLKRRLTERALAVRALADQLQTAIYHSPFTDEPPYIEGHWYQNGLGKILVIWSNESNREAEVTLQIGEGPVWLFDPLGNGTLLLARDGKVKFRVYYDPQFVRGFTHYEGISFRDNQNDAPYFVSTPIQRAVVGRPYTYMVQAYDSDPSGQPNALIPLTYNLSQRPNGMSIGDRSGRITWQPNAAGDYSITIQARDPQGNTATQSFVIRVVLATQNVPPQILSSPRATYGAFGIPYGYNVNAWDANGDEITYSLSQSPHWLQIDSKTGFVSGIPDQGGVFRVTIQASDQKDGITEQSFVLQIFSSVELKHHLYLPVCTKP